MWIAGKDEAGVFVRSESTGATSHYHDENMHYVNHLAKHLNGDHKRYNKKCPKCIAERAAKPVKATFIPSDEWGTPVAPEYKTTLTSTLVKFCTHCGSTDRENTEGGDQGYSACCNEPVDIKEA